jgi:hypothetical protein
MSTVSKLALLALGLVPALGVAQSEAGPWRFIAPDSKELLSVDWGRIRTSHIVKLLREKWIDGAAFPGTEFLDAVDNRFLISSPGKNSNDPDAEGGLLVVVSGHFDLSRVRTVLAQYRLKPQQYNSFQVYRPQGKDPKDWSFVLFDSRTILMGDTRSIFACLDRAAFPAAEPPPGSPVARAADMDSIYDVWAIVDTPGAFGTDRLTAFLRGSDQDTGSQALEFGLSLRDGLALDYTMTLGSNSAAKQMAAELSRIIKLAVKDKLGEPALVDLEKKMKFTAQGSLAKLTVRLTAQELEKNAQIFAASHKPPAAAPAASGLAQVRSVVKPEPAPPMPPEKKVIRIEGLDGGPREIPYQENH